MAGLYFDKLFFFAKSPLGMFLKHIIVFFLTLLFLSTIVPVSAKSTPPSKIEIEFNKLFKRAMRVNHIPGATYAIVRGDRVSTIKAYGVRGQKNNKAIDKDTSFRLASVSKTFSAELAALMIEKKSFAWNDSIVDYIPEFKLKQAGQAEAITIKHVLSHSSGLMPNAFDGYLKGGFQFSHIISKFEALEPYCSPGACYGYQNVLFSFIAEVFKRSTGKAYAELMQQMIFSPLAMNNASVGFDAYKNTTNKAYPHVKVSRNGPWHQVKIKPDFYKVEAAAGINASITDMSKWLLAQLGHTPEVISAHLLETVREPVVSTEKDVKSRTWKGIIDDAHYGIGWRVYQYNEDILYFHSGWVEGFRAVIAYSKDKQIGLVILANAESRSIDKLTVDFWRLLLKEPSVKETLLVKDIKPVKANRSVKDIKSSF
ncbi:beta-lactamase [Psychromonas ingrahamii 37]|uniref:Beta-lactamase n=2 Tax=Psychromonas ingrahamii TaxID=357794 RepID=A1SVA3_PSYIN|nr:beta-lactamase [Psychromonas ingrahamii 37]